MGLPHALIISSTSGAISEATASSARRRRVKAGDSRLASVTLLIEGCKAASAKHRLPSSQPPSTRLPLAYALVDVEVQEAQVAYQPAGHGQHQEREGRHATAGRQQQPCQHAEHHDVEHRIGQADGLLDAGLRTRGGTGLDDRDPCQQRHAGGQDERIQQPGTIAAGVALVVERQQTQHDDGLAAEVEDVRERGERALAEAIEDGPGPVADRDQPQPDAKRQPGHRTRRSVEQHAADDEPGPDEAPPVVCQVLEVRGRQQ